MNQVWIGSEPPRSNEYRHIVPLRSTPVPAGFAKELSSALESLGENADPFESAALVSLLPWFSVWVHRCVEIASALPDDDELRNLPAVASDADSLEKTLIGIWSRVRVTSVTRNKRRTRRRPPSLERITSLANTLAAPIDVERSDVLFVSLQTNSTRSVLPVARILRESGRRVSFAHLALDRGSSELLAGEGFSRVPLERLTSFRSLTSVRPALRFLERTMRAPRLANLFSELPLPSWLPGTTLCEVFIGLARARFLTALLKGIAISNAIELVAPSALVFPSDHALVSRTSTKAAKILFLQGIVPPCPPVSQRLRVDKAIVGSSLDLEYTLSSGIPREATEVVGYPEYAIFDELDGATCRKRLFETLGTRAFASLVLFTSQYSTELFPDWARRKNLEITLEFAKQNPNTLVVLKPHPRREHLDADWLSSLPSNVAVAPTGFTSAELMKAADVVVTYWSTTALEALLLEVPLVQLNSTGLADYYPIGARAGLPVARSAEDLDAQVSALLGSTARRKSHLEAQRTYLEQAQIPGAEKAAQRSAAVIESALREQRKHP